MDLLGIWYAITLLGTPEYWAVLALVFVAIYFILGYSVPENPSWKKFRPGFRKFLMIFIPSILLVFGATLLIKNLWYVQRPCTPCAVSLESCNPYCDTDSSFPSGHAGTSFVVFSSLYLSTRRRMKKDGLSQSYKAVNPKVISLFIIPVLISCSRVALGVHTWIDVLGGHS